MYEIYEKSYIMCKKVQWKEITYGVPLIFYVDKIWKRLINFWFRKYFYICNEDYFRDFLAPVLDYPQG